MSAYTSPDILLPMGVRNELIRRKSDPAVKTCNAPGITIRIKVWIEYSFSVTETFMINRNSFQLILQEINVNEVDFKVILGTIISEQRLMY